VKATIVHGDAASVTLVVRFYSTPTGDFRVDFMRRAGALADFSAVFNEVRAALGGTV
jgi:hypothetical protein